MKYYLKDIKKAFKAKYFLKKDSKNNILSSNLLKIVQKSLEKTKIIKYAYPLKNSFREILSYFLKNYKLISHKNNYLNLINLKRIKSFNIDDLNPEEIFLTIYISSGIIIMLIIFTLISLPMMKNNSLIKEDISLAKLKKSKVPELAAQTNMLQKKYNSLKDKRNTLINLIGGNTKLTTLLSIIDFLANKNSVILTKFEPIEIKQYNKSDNTSTQSNNIPNVQNQQNQNYLSENNTLDEKVEKFDLMAPELKQSIIDITLKGDFVNILDMLKDLENLENIVLTDDFKIDRLFDPNKVSKSNIQYETKLSIYGKI